MWVWLLACGLVETPTDSEAGRSLADQQTAELPVPTVSETETEDTEVAPTALVYGPTHHAAYDLLEDLGFEVTLWRAEEWMAASTEDFAAFSLIVVDSQTCMGPDENGELQWLEDSQDAWGPALTGRVLVSGLDLSCHIVDWEPYEGGDETVPPQLFDNTMQWLAAGGGTAAYFATDWGRRELAHLEVLGTWAEEGLRGDIVTVVEPEHPVFDGIASDGLDHWGATYHTQFTVHPDDFASLADGADGYSMMLAREAE